MKQANCSDTMASFVSPTGRRNGSAVAGGTRTGGGIVATAYRTLLIWQERVRMRAALRRMDLTMLSDIGLTYDQARREFEKPFWIA